MITNIQLAIARVLSKSGIPLDITYPGGPVIRFPAGGDYGQELTQRASFRAYAAMAPASNARANRGTSKGGQPSTK